MGTKRLHIIPLIKRKLCQKSTTPKIYPTVISLLVKNLSNNINGNIPAYWLNIERVNTK